MSLGSHAWRRLGTWLQSTLSRAAHCARAHTQRAPSQRDHNAPTTLPRVEHHPARTRQVGLRGMADEALDFLVGDDSEPRVGEEIHEIRELSASPKPAPARASDESSGDRHVFGISFGDAAA